MARRELSEAVLSSADHLAPVDLAVGLLTYNNAETLDGVLDTAAAGLKKVIAEHGPQAVGFLSSARLTNEENYLIQKLARTGVGTNSVHSCEST